MEIKEDFIHYEGDNMFPVGVEAQKCLDVLKEFFLGENYYVSCLMSVNQANVIITDNIMHKFPKEYKKFCKKKGWEYRNGK